MASTAARLLPHPDLTDIALPAVLFALSDPARLEIVRQRTLTLRSDEIEQRFPGLLDAVLN